MEERGFEKCWRSPGLLTFERIKLFEVLFQSSQYKIYMKASFKINRCGSNHLMAVPKRNFKCD